MAWTDDINNLVHQHVKPYDKAAQLAHAVTGIALDVTNRQTEQLNRLDEVIDDLSAQLASLRGASRTFLAAHAVNGQEPEFVVDPQDVAAFEAALKAD